MGKQVIQKGGGRRLHKALSAAFVRTIGEPGRHFDGNGLFLLVEPTGAKRWKQRLTIRGRRVELGIGSYPNVSLAHAREAADENQREARDGGDPKRRRMRERALPTFEEAAKQVHELRRAGWRNERHAEQWLLSLERYVFPRIGAQTVDVLTVEDVLAVLTPIWHKKPQTARKLRQRVAAVFSWAVATGWRGDNPAETVRAVLPRQRAVSRPYRAVHYADVSDAIASVRGSKVAPGLRLGFEFMVLTAARGGEVRLATWREFNLKAGVWTVPAERMKMEREHRVPLSGRAIGVLDEARALTGGVRGGLVFPGRAGRALRPEAFIQAIKRMGIDATAHGFRSSFRTWAAERTNIPREVAEAALAHENPNKVEAVYQRSDLFDRRRGLMDAWATYLDAEAAAVVSLDERRTVAV